MSSIGVPRVMPDPAGVRNGFRNRAAVFQVFGLQLLRGNQRDLVHLTLVAQFYPVACWHDPIAKPASVVSARASPVSSAKLRLMTDTASRPGATGADANGCSLYSRSRRRGRKTPGRHKAGSTTDTELPGEIGAMRAGSAAIGIQGEFRRIVAAFDGHLPYDSPSLR